MTPTHQSVPRLAAACLTALAIAGCGADGPTPPPSMEWLGLREAVRYGTGGTALTSLAAADVTDDGRADLLAVASGDAVRMLRALGGGVFAAATVQAAGADPRQALTGDVNGDGRPDLVVIGHFDNAFFVRLGTSIGQFAAPTSYALRNHGRRVAVADVNRDGYDDVIAVHDGSGQPVYVSVFLGAASGSMRKAWEIGTTFATGRDVAVGAFDGDGRPDFVVAVGDSRTGLLVFRGLGTGEFTSPEVLLPIPTPTPGATDGTSSVAAEDVNGDGLDDLVVAHDTFVEGISVRLSTGTGFAAPSIIDDTPALDVALADLDADGRTDVIATHLEEGTLSVLLGIGSGGFSPAREFRVGPAPVSLALADLDGDGRPDVAVTDVNDHQVRVLLNRGP